MYKVEINAAQMKSIREFFDNYKDDKVDVKLIDASNRIKSIYEVETELTQSETEKYLKELFRNSSKSAATLYYTIKVN